MPQPVRIIPLTVMQPIPVPPDQIATDGTADCDGASKTAEILAARLPSIKDETKRIIAGLHYDESLANTQNDFLKVTVCSGDINFNIPHMSSPDYAALQR